jgi:tetratricopeptide (TPR) repeat protein
LINSVRKSGNPPPPKEQAREAAAAPETQSWTLADILRQFALRKKQIEAWQARNLFPVREIYSFEDLATLRVLIKLREVGVSNQEMETAVAQLRAALKVEDPLKQLRVSAAGKRLSVEAAGKKMEANSGQFLLDFDPDEIQKLLAFPGEKVRERKNAHKARMEAENWFQRGLELEQNGSDKREAIAAYEEALGLCPDMAGALVNIGTIYFNARKWREAERYYQQAVQSDGKYPLAHFNLANLHEELGRTSLAIQHYKKALELSPTYADAHYNLALLYQTRERPMEAMRHWKLYLQFDPSSHWGSIARRELTRLKEATLIRPKNGDSQSETA